MERIRRTKTFVGFLFFLPFLVLSCQSTAPVKHEKFETAEVEPETIRRNVRDQIPQVKACYEKVLNKLPEGQGPKGKVVLAWTIKPDGSVDKARIDQSEIKSPELENCLVERLKTWRFPPPGDDQFVEIRFPFHFSPASEDIELGRKKAK